MKELPALQPQLRDLSINRSGDLSLNRSIGGPVYEEIGAPSVPVTSDENDSDFDRVEYPVDLDPEVVERQLRDGI